MLKVSVKCDGVKQLQEHIKYVEKLLKMKKDKHFQQYIQKLCLAEVKSYAKLRLDSSGTTNEDLKSQYIDTIFVREHDNGSGFDIVSNLTVEKPTTKHSQGYTFSVSLAFEYGTGIIGMGSSDAPPEYRYNVNENQVSIDGNLIDGWWIPANKVGNSITFGTSKSGKAFVTKGYEGMEIFRFAGANIMQKLPIWIKQYFEKEV